MADWSAGVCDKEPAYQNGQGTSSPGSGRSSVSSGHSQRSDLALSRANGQSGERASPQHSPRIKLADGDRLTEESSDKSNVYVSLEEKPTIPSRQPTGPAQKKALKSMGMTTSFTNIDAISEEDVEIPADGCLLSFTTDQMANFFRCLKITDHVVKHMHRKGVDGKKFSKFKDTDLETLGIKNPVVCYFRDRSKKKRVPFML